MKSSAAAIEAGLRVVRGPNWKYQDHDGGEGYVGTVVGIDTTQKKAEVQWDVGTRGEYRIGCDDCYDLRILDNAPIG